MILENVFDTFYKVELFGFCLNFVLLYMKATMDSQK